MSPFVALSSPELETRLEGKRLRTRDTRARAWVVEVVALFSLVWSCLSSCTDSMHQLTKGTWKLENISASSAPYYFTFYRNLSYRKYYLSERGDSLVLLPGYDFAEGRSWGMAEDSLFIGAAQYEILNRESQRLVLLDAHSDTFELTAAPKQVLEFPL